MTDTDAELRKFLVGQSALVALIGQRLYASQTLPTGYTPQTGAALLFSVRGGPQDYSGKVLMPSYQFRGYAQDETLARKVGHALYDVLDGAKSGKMKMAVLEVVPILLTDPDTRWIYSLSFYKISFSN